MRAELLRQHRREIDLAKILAKLYERYLELVAATGRMTARDLVIAAADLVSADGAFANALRERHPFAFVDDAQELTNGELRLFSAIYGETLNGVTLCWGSLVGKFRGSHDQPKGAVCYRSIDERAMRAISPRPRRELLSIARNRRGSCRYCRSSR